MAGLRSTAGALELLSNPKQAQSAIANLCGWGSSICLVRIFRPTVPAYWATMALSGMASCAMLGRAFARTALRRPAQTAPTSPRPSNQRQVRHMAACRDCA